MWMSVNIALSERRSSRDSLLTATGMMINRSMYKNFRHAQYLLGDSHEMLTWKSPRDDANEYSMVMVVN